MAAEDDGGGAIEMMEMEGAFDLGQNVEVFWKTHGRHFPGVIVAIARPSPSLHYHSHVR